MKRIILYVILIVCNGISFTSCQDDEFETTNGVEVVSSNNLSIVREDTLSFCVPKAFPTMRHKSVYYKDTYERLHRYETIQIKCNNSGIIQEWFYENLKIDDYFPDCYVRPDDPDTLKGLYYMWETNFAYVSRGDWNELFFYEDGTPALDFNLPREKDIELLGREFGNTSYIRARIGLDYNGDYSSAFGFSTGAGCPANIGVDASDDHNKVRGCGVHVQWSNPRNNVFYCYPNSPYVAHCVRLMRTLPISEW